MTNLTQVVLLLIQIPGAVMGLSWVIFEKRPFRGGALACLMLAGWPRRLSWLLGFSLPAWMDTTAIPLYFAASLLLIIWVMTKE